MRKDSYHSALKSRRIDTILVAYDKQHQYSDHRDKGLYLSSFYFDTRYPRDNYTEIVEEQVEKAYRYASDLKQYFETELEKLNKRCSSQQLNIDTLPKLNG